MSDESFHFSFKINFCNIFPFDSRDNCQIIPFDSRDNCQIVHFDAVHTMIYKKKLNQ
jgi:hypothetical protein